MILLTPLSLLSEVIYEQCKLIIMELHIAELLVLPAYFFGVEFPLFVVPYKALQRIIPTRYAVPCLCQLIQGISPT